MSTCKIFSELVQYVEYLNWMKFFGEQIYVAELTYEMNLGEP